MRGSSLPATALWVALISNPASGDPLARSGDTSQAQGTPWSIGAAWGSGSEDSDTLRLSFSKPWKRRWFEGGRAYLTGYWEVSVARFRNAVSHVPADDGTANLWNLAAAPVFRLQFELGDARSIQPFLDLGVGVSFMSDQNFRTGKARSRPLGSRFQFEDRGAIGIRGQRWELAYQRMHYSNLDLASANHGIDAHLLQLRWSFTR